MMDITDPWLMPRIDTIYLVALVLITEIVNVHWFIRNMLWVMRFLFGIVVYLVVRHVFFICLYFYRYGSSGFNTWIKDNYTGNWFFIKGDLGIKLETYNEQLIAYKIDLFWLALYFPWSMVGLASFS